MISNTLRRAGATLTLIVAVAALTGAAGCKRKDKTGSAPAASGSAAQAAGPCGEYAEKVCAKTGAESPTCTSFKEATGLMSDSTCKAGIKDIAVSLQKLKNQRGDCDKLTKTLCDGVGAKSKTCEMVTTQTAQFPPARCKAMLEHVPEIMEDLKKREAANQPLSKELQAAIAGQGAPAFGPDNALVTIVEFSDFQCPYCSRAADVAHQLKEKYGTKVRFVFRQFPLPMHPQARGAAVAALAANAQGKFWEFHDELFKNQQALAAPNLEEHAKKIGLNLAQFKKSLDDKAFAEQVDADMKLGEQVQVQGTPTMFLNGARIENPTDFATIATQIDAALGGASPG
jgi:protein-disulfide isomerase